MNGKIANVEKEREIEMEITNDGINYKNIVAFGN